MTDHDCTDYLVLALFDKSVDTKYGSSFRCKCGQQLRCKRLNETRMWKTLTAKQKNDCVARGAHRFLRWDRA